MIEQIVQDLYHIVIPTDGNRPAELEFPEASLRVEVVFNKLEDRLIGLLRECDAVFGCVAWVTSEPILRALAKKQAVSLIVQKEDFLRPDLRADPRGSGNPAYARCTTRSPSRPIATRRPGAICASV